MNIDIRDGLLQIFNVDHGACALLTMPMPQGAKRVLIDCGQATDLGGKPWLPGQHLRQLGIGHVDMLVCTNYDEDHASGVPSLLQNGISVGCILGNDVRRPRLAAVGCHIRLRKTTSVQETVPYYYRKARGVPNVCDLNPRYVMTTRDDGELVFRWENGRCQLC